MSRYIEMKTNFKDRDCLVKALKDVGYGDVELHDAAQPLVGYRGDFRSKDDWNAHTRDPEKAVKAHVIVRRKHISSIANDLGFERMPDGKFRAIISAYDSSKHNQTWQNTLTQRYNRALDRKVAKAGGWVTTEKVMPDGTIKLRLRR